MKIYIGMRRSGKTRRLIEESSRNGIPICTSNDRQRESIKAVAEELNIMIPEPVYCHKTYGNPKQEVLVDNIDLVFRKMMCEMGYEVVGGTMDTEENSVMLINENLQLAPAKKLKKTDIRFVINQIYTDGTTTVVKFADGEQVKVKCGEGEEPNTYTAVCAAIAKKLYGSNSALKREIVEKTVWQEKKTKKERKS